MLKCLIKFCFLFIVSTGAWAQTYTTTRVSTDDSTSPLVGGSPNKVILGFSVTKTGGPGSNLTNLVLSTGSTDPTTVFSSVQLQKSATNFAAAVNTGATATLNAGNITFAGAPIHTFSASAETEFFYVVVTVSANVASTVAMVPSITLGPVTEANTTYTGGAPTETAFSFSGSTFDFQALTATVIQEPITANYIQGNTDKPFFGFKIKTNGTSQDLNQVVFTLNIDPNSATALSTFKLVDNGVSSTYAGGGTTVAAAVLNTAPNTVTFNSIGIPINSVDKYFFLVADVNPAMTPATVTSTLTSVAVNNPVGAGGTAGAGIGANQNATIAALALTVNPITPGTGVVPASAVLFAGSTTQVLAGFAVSSTGAQTISQLDFNYTPAPSIVTEYLYKNTVAGTLAGATIVDTDNTPDGMFNNAATLSEVINSTTVYYYLVVDVATTVTAATTAITPSLTQTGITVGSGTKNAFSFSRSYSFSTSQNSTIVLNGGTTNNIDYVSKRTGNPLTSGNSVSLATFRIRDGGGAADGDDKPTVLTQLIINIPANHTMVRRVALFDGGSIVSGTQQDVTGSTITFSGLSLTTTNDGSTETKDFTIRATFQNIVTDNARIDVTITGATASAAGSGFASFGATTAGVAAPANQIEVTASALSLFGNPSNTTIATNFPLFLRAIDSQTNIDLDYSGTIALTRSGGAGTLSVQPGESLTPTLTNGIYNWTTLRLSQAGNYILTASDNAGNDEFTDPTVNISVSSSASTITQPSALNLCFGGLSQTLGNIVITETDPSGFSSGGSFALTLPSGFIFDQSVTTAPSVGGGSDISAPTALSYPAANTVQFSYTISGTANTNSITITGLKIMHPHPGGDAPGTNSGSITRSGGTASVAGVVPGTALGSVSATLGSPAPAGFGFTVQKLNSGDVNVDPNETRFSQNSNSVRLVGTPAAIGGATHEFIGSGVTFISGEYRFNPQSLSPGTYPIVFKYRDGTGQKCEFQAGKTFEIYTTNITNLNAQYCNNEAQTPDMNVNSYIATFYSSGGYSGWALDRFIYWDTPAPFGQQQKDITAPSNVIFDPKLPAYQPIYSATGNVYGVIGIWIGFIITGSYDAPPTTVCNTVCYPLIGCIEVCTPVDPPPVTQTRTVWQLIPVRPAPAVSFSIPKTAFCSDETPVTLVGSPANSDVIGQDFFTPSSDPGSVTSSPAPGVVWSFNPQAVAGAPKSMDITYTYRDPATGCVGTSAPKTITINPRPTTVPIGSISNSPAASPSTTIELCQGVQVGSFTGAPISGTTYTWYADQTLTLVKGTLNSFTPPVDNTVATPIGNPPKFYVTRTIAGCESDKSPTVPTPARELTIIVHPTPGPPVTPDLFIPYCVNESLDPNDFKILGGTNINWYLNGNSSALLTNVSSPTIAQIISTPGLGVDNSNPANYIFEVTQTANNCEGRLTPTKVSVEIRPLPKLKIDPKGGFDPANICTSTQTQISFVGTDQGNPTSNGVWSTVGPSFSPGSLIPDSGLGEVRLLPIAENPDNYTLKYEFTNANGCTNNTTLPLTILPKVATSLIPLDSCAGLFVRLNNQSVIDKGNLATSTTTIDSTSWIFSDGSGLARGKGPVPFPITNDGRTKGTYFSPEHKFKITGSVNLQYTMKTSDLCVYTGTRQLTIAPKPEMDFSWRNVCRDGTSDTQFIATEKNGLPISKYNWTFNDNNTLGIASAQNLRFDPTVNYNSDGSDFATLIVTTTSQCKDTVSKPIYIVPKFAPITDNNSYTQDFNISKDGWLVGGVNPSWEWGVPSKKGSEAIGSKGNAWDTRLNGTNNPNEQSWVLSRCFNFSQSHKPVIGLDIFSETPSIVNGAAIQYNYNGNIEDDASWYTLGEVGKGINWYDAQGISNSPGNQAANDLGWTGNENTTNGKYKEWRRAYYQLDGLLSLTPTQKSNVVFRIAFAAGNSRSDGFAFDDFFIGERSRIVLLENFTNSSSNLSAHNDKYSGLGNPNEIVRVQYHTPFPGDDAINKLNTPMHNGRTAFYGITKSPTMRLDGIEGNKNTVEDIYDDRVLTPSPLEVIVTPTKVGGVVEIVTTIRNKSSQPIALAGTHIFTTIVEKSVTNTALLGNSGNSEFVFVGKQMLPTPTGLEIPSNLAAGATYTAPKVIWEVNNGDAIVVSVQSIEGNNKEVYQAGVSLTPPQPDIVTGIEHIAEFIQLFPNPASNSFVIELPTKTDSRLSVHMIDQVGRVVHESAIEVGEQSKTINTQDLAGGIYIVQIGAGKSGVVRKKMMIVHKN